MTRYTVDTRYIPDRERLADVRPRHREYLRRLADKGEVLAAGPWAGDTGGFAVYDVADPAALYRALADDPYTIEGIAAERVIREWTVVIGSWFPGER